MFYNDRIKVEIQAEFMEAKEAEWEKMSKYRLCFPCYLYTLTKFPQDSLIVREIFYKLRGFK